MLLAQKQGVDDLIVAELAKNPYSTGPFLVRLVNKNRKETTKQAVYIALKTLMESEIVAKVGSTNFLSRVWLTRLDQLFQAQKEKEFGRDAIFDLREKESISYHFPNLLTTDTYWAHVFDLLQDWMPKDHPIVGWMPHEWFVIGREEVERNLFKKHVERQKYMCHTIGGTTPLDKGYQREWENPFVSIYTTDEALFPRTYYLHVFEDFLIEVFVIEELALEIDQFYSAHEKLTPQDKALFENLITKHSPVRMKISRRKKKAAILRKRLTKNFYLPTGIIAV